MMNSRILKNKEQVIIESVRMATFNEAVEDLKRAKESGADSALVHFQMITEPLTDENIKKIIEATDLPIMAINYRDKNGKESADVDEERASVMTRAIELGATCVDVWGDMFDNDSRQSLSNCSLPFASANPKEITMDPDCVRRQKEYIDKIHALGGEVLMSSHVGVELSIEQTVSLALEIESRGVDIVKIIANANTKEQAMTVMHTLPVLTRTLKVPFLYQCSGPYARFVRIYAPMFGSCAALCHTQYGGITNPEKPLIKDVQKGWALIENK